MNENAIRRERARKVAKQKTIEEMRAALPVYSLEEIRQHRLPFHEALICNLCDSGYEYTANFISQLFEVQEKLRKEGGPYSQIWTRPQLINCKKELNDLCDRLIKAELYKKRSEYEFMHGRYEALSSYAYGKFLMERFKQTAEAQDHLQRARILSKDQIWTTKPIFPLDGDVLFLKVNYLLYTCLITQVEALLDTDLEKASRLAILARKRASDACYPEGEITALMLKGMCELSRNETKAAISTFTKVYHMQSQLGSDKGICEVRMLVANAHLLDGNEQLSLSTLLMLKESADELNLPFYLAQSYRHLGEFFLNRGEPSKATPFLSEALKIFYERECHKEAEQVRNLEAISSGLELFTTYVTLLNKSNTPECLMNLIDWKDSRKSFMGLGESLTSLPIDKIIRDSVAQFQLNTIDDKMSERRGTAKKSVRINENVDVGRSGDNDSGVIFTPEPRYNPGIRYPVADVGNSSDLQIRKQCMPRPTEGSYKHHFNRMVWIQSARELEQDNVVPAGAKNSMILSLVAGRKRAETVYSGHDDPCGFRAPDDFTGCIQCHSVMEISQTPIEMHPFSGFYLELSQLLVHPFYYSKGVEDDRNDKHIRLRHLILPRQLGRPDLSESVLVLAAESVLYHTYSLGGALFDT
ncbi:hypothetical protein NQ317_002905 [Molorchus minor]|uniref:Tetratricopeptide repeat protein 29 n=1 Tax=Molorchus minor TaxID=1323400 RepID=A0ABQ9JI84_9CUCU|nr:hypothetical protein NQ317_002905 [Molorchus minor]